MNQVGQTGPRDVLVLTKREQDRLHLLSRQLAHRSRPAGSLNQRFPVACAQRLKIVDHGGVEQWRKQAALAIPLIFRG
jgi:hypothetical protein